MSESMANSMGIGKKTLTNRVYEFIKQGIMYQEFAQFNLGKRLNETEIATLLGVSPTPIREALNMLKSEGLVVGNSYQGSFVIDFSLEDINNIFDIRELLELEVIRKAFSNLKQEDINRLEQILSQYENAYQNMDLKMISEYNNSFHGYLMEKTGNKWLKNILESIREFLILARAPLMKKRKENKEFDKKEAVFEHKEILLALKQKDLQKAESVMKGHINRMRIEMCSFLESKQKNLLLRKEETIDELIIGDVDKKLFL
ncbi:MAG: GntR family transcriptional regulator [Peptococcaceae bacterium]